MKLSLVTSTYLALAASILAEDGHYCVRDDHAIFNICGYGKILTYVRPTTEAIRLHLPLDNISVISPFAFNHVTLEYLLLTRDNSSNCLSQAIDLSLDSFTGLSVTYHLQLDCMTIQKPADAFSHFRSLPSLALKRFHFMGMPYEFFVYFPHLYELTLADLNIRSITPSTFRGVNEGLRILHIDDNVTVVQPRSFAQFSMLNALRISHGQLTDLQDDMFEGLDQLKALDLTRNKIRTVPNGVFSKLTQLQGLYLNDNQISVFEPSALSGVKLSILILDNNKLKSLTPGAYNDHQWLSILSLRGNSIRSVPFNMFRGYKRLQWLYLDHNEIQDIYPYALRGLTLRQLHLRNNQLSTLSQSTFDGLVIEEFLDLSSNNITYIEPLTFANLTAETIFLCPPGNQTDRSRWGVSRAIKRIVGKDCPD